MELKELSTVAFAPGVSSHFATSWSEDNKVCIVTAKGIHIFELIPNPKNSKCRLSMRQYWLRVPEIRATKDAGVDTSKLVWKLPKYSVYELILDASLSPYLGNTKPVPVHIASASWSPAGVLQHCRCLLAVVLNSGAILLYGPRSWRWLVLCNVSKVWQKHCANQWPNVPPTMNFEEQFDILKERTSTLKMTAFAWGQLHHGSCKFAVAHADSRISVWSIAVLQEAQWDAADVQFISVTETKLGRLSTIFCSPIGTVVGDIDGRISLLPDVFKDVLTETDILEDVSTETYSPYMLWEEEDHIRVNAIISLPQTPEHESLCRWIILAVKKTFVIVFVLDNKGHKIAEYAHRVGGLNISGLVTITTDGVIITTHTGHVCKLTIRINKSEQVTVESENIVTNFKLKDVACYGITCSRNQTIWAVVTSICKLYDHLVHRKPGQVIFCTSLTDADLTSCLTNNSGKTLYETGEYLELIRMSYVRNKTIPSVLNLQYPEMLDAVDASELCTELWLAQMKLTLLPNCSDEDKEQQMELTEKYIKDLVDGIQIQHAISTLKNLKIISSQRTLTVHEKLSAYQLDTWLKIFVSKTSESVTNVVREALEDPLLADDKEMEEERCLICNQDIPMTADYRMSECLNGHKQARCNRSLRPCVQVPYFMCPTPGCGAVAHKDITNVDSNALCIYCGTVLQLDNRVYGGHKPTPTDYRITPDSSNVRTESTKISSDKTPGKYKGSTLGEEFIEKHTYIIQVKDDSAENTNDVDMADGEND